MKSFAKIPAINRGWVPRGATDMGDRRCYFWRRHSIFVSSSIEGDYWMLAISRKGRGPGDVECARTLEDFGMTGAQESVDGLVITRYFRLVLPPEQRTTRAPTQSEPSPSPLASGLAHEAGVVAPE